MTENIWLDSVQREDEETTTDEETSTNETTANETTAKKAKKDKELYTGAHLKISDFSLKLNQFRLVHHLSDRTTDALLKLFADILPIGNKAPTTLRKINKVCEASVGEKLVMTNRSLNPETDVFGITGQLCEIIKSKGKTYKRMVLKFKKWNKMVSQMQKHVLRKYCKFT